MSAIFLGGLSFLSHSETVQEPVVDHEKVFIETLLPDAKELQARHGILPSIIIGQAILESDWGRSELSRQYHNLFGIKAYGDGGQVSLMTKEFVDGKWIDINANFRVYDNWADSMTDHTNLFLNGVSWNPALYQEVLIASDYKVAAQALQAAGYATDPDYQQKIISVIEQNELNRYDN